LILLLIFVVRTSASNCLDVSEMTYNVSSGTLNLTYSRTHSSNVTSYEDNRRQPKVYCQLKLRYWPFVYVILLLLVILLILWLLVIKSCYSIFL